MVRHLCTYWFGSFLIDGEVVSRSLFPKDADGIAKRLSVMRDGKVLKEERELAKRCDSFLVHEARLEELGGLLSREPRPELDSSDFGYDVALLQKAHVLLAKDALKKPRKGDREAVWLLRFRDDLVDSRDMMSERLAGWAEELYPGITSVRDWRRAVASDDVERFASGRGLDASIFRKNHPHEGEWGRALAKRLGETDDAIARLDGDISSVMESTCPNLTRLVGPLLAARLIMLSGGLEALAMTSSSRVQMLGAEKALFRHRKRGGKPPKHGVVLQHPLVHSRRKSERGRAARLLSAKVVIAARADALTGRDLGTALLDDLHARLGKDR